MIRLARRKLDGHKWRIKLKKTDNIILSNILSKVSGGLVSLHRGL
jgi:hypothetical protein